MAILFLLALAINCDGYSSVELPLVAMQ